MRWMFAEMIRIIGFIRVPIRIIQVHDRHKRGAPPEFKTAMLHQEMPAINTRFLTPAGAEMHSLATMVYMSVADRTKPFFIPETRIKADRQKFTAGKNPQYKNNK
jgi:hypothetical protein